MSAARTLLAFSLLGVLPAGVRPAPRIVQKDKRFSPIEIHLRLGDSLVFVNADNVSHNVFSNTAGLKFNLKRQSPGTSVAIPFLTRGTADVRCAFHPSMKLKVVVE